jgi:hypothetical protein
MSVVCPYCDIEISDSSVEAEEGCCPECGAMLMGPVLFGAAEADDFEDDDIDVEKGFEDVEGIEEEAVEADKAFYHSFSQENEEEI